MGTLADRIKEAARAAEKKGYTVEDIAKRCKISRQAVYLWFNGETKSIKGPNLIELAEISGYNPAWIMKGTGQKMQFMDIEAQKFMQLSESGQPPLFFRPFVKCA